VSTTFIIPNKDNLESILVATYNSLHKYIVTNRYPLSQIEDLLDHLQGYYSFTQMNLIANYNKFHRNVIIHFGKCVVIYLYDIFVFINSWEKHLQCIYNILKLLWAHKLQVNKFYCGYTSVPHVGLILDTTWSRSDPSQYFFQKG
jgi:hypothetical protein